jgi:signal transduction histidine kinase/streptogramin lyase
LNAEGKIIRHLKNDPVDQFSLSENSVNCIYGDNSGVIWVGTFGAGISMYDPQAHKFSLYRHRAGDDKSIASNFIWTIFETGNGEIWLGSDNKGITRYIPAREEYLFYDHEPENPNSLAASSVRDIFQDSKGRIWIGTDGGGLNRFLPENQEFIHYKYKDGDSRSISDNSVRVIFEDRYGVLWVGTRNGLNRFDPETETFQRYLHSPDDSGTLSHNFIYASIFQDLADNLWIGTYGGGLNVMDHQTGTFKSYQSDPDDPNSLSDDIVFDIYQDPKTGFLWIGTNNGLNRFDFEKQSFTRFGLSDGLPNEVIYSVVPDQSGNLWLSTNAGICCFNPYSFNTVSYDVTDGLQSNEFNGGAFHKGKSGKLYFGGVYGLNIINPGQLPKLVMPEKVVLTGMEILGKEVRVAENYNEQQAGSDSNGNDYYLVNKSIPYLDTLILSYQHRFFSFEFIVPGNINAQRMDFSYRMGNLDDQWINSGNRNYVTYANMKPGKYSFQARAGLDENTWGMPSKPLTLIIEPPYWQRWWFYLFELIVMILVTFFTYRYLLKTKTNKLLRTQNIKITEANTKLAQSEKELRELNATKDKFFSIIAHDLKNPFASLMSITDVMHKNYSLLDEDEKNQGIEKIDNSVKGIFQLLENLLTWSRAQSNRIKFEPVLFDLTLLIHEVVLIYTPLAKAKGIDLTETSESDLVKVFADREMVHTILRNLVNNAIKFSSSGDTISIHSVPEDDWVCVKVRDTGIGISEESLSKLFKIDAKIKSNGTAGEKGTGLGLILCREFIEMNSGKFFIDSELGRGTVFTFKLKHSEK